MSIWKSSSGYRLGMTDLLAWNLALRYNDHVLYVWSGEVTKSARSQFVKMRTKWCRHWSIPRRANKLTQIALEQILCLCTARSKKWVWNNLVQPPAPKFWIEMSNTRQRIKDCHKKWRRRKEENRTPTQSFLAYSRL